MKGGAAGGGLSQIEPSSKINLHFNSDFHAISSAHNLLAALVGAHLFHGNDLHLDPKQITWPRAIDMNDRALRHIRLSLDSKKEDANRQSGFIITAASEIMAIIALARDRKDLGRRLDAIVLGAEKYFDIVMPQSGIVPPAAVLVTTVRSIKNQGGRRLCARAAESWQTY